MSRLSHGLPTALQSDNQVIIFSGNGVRMHNIVDAFNLPKGSWALADCTPTHPIPCACFVGASVMHTAYIVLAASPHQSQGHWLKDCKVDKYVMKYFSQSEMIALGFVLIYLSIYFH